MAKKDTGKVPSPGPGLTPVGAWSENSAAAAPPATPTADGGSGVAGGAPSDALPAIGGGSGTDLQGIHAALSALTAQFSGALTGVSEQIATVAGRLDTLESERGGSDSGESQRRSSSDSGSEGSSVSGDSYAAPEYLQVIGKDNRHWNAAQRELDADQRPRRHSLYGYEPYDELRRGKHKGGGVLGLTMRYVEPAALYLQTAINGVENCRDACDLGDPLASDLDACANTIKGVYGLINTLRTLVSRRASVLSPGATPADKKRLEWVEQQLDGDDFASADTASKIRKLEASYDHEASKADLRRAASSGRASGGSTGRYADTRSREPAGKSSSAKRRERRKAADNKGSGGEAGKSSRSKSKKSVGSKPKARESSRGADSEGSEQEQRGGKKRDVAPKSNKRSDSDKASGGKQHAREERPGRGGTREPFGRGGGRSNPPGKHDRASGKSKGKARASSRSDSSSSSSDSDDF